jgi:hypothetical protein
MTIPINDLVFASFACPVFFGGLLVMVLARFSKVEVE